MKRRQFMTCSTAAAVLGALPCSAGAALRGSLFDDPHAWIGTTFRMQDGASLELAGVEEVCMDACSHQVRLQFRTMAGRVPTECIQRLDCGWREDELFLQAGRDGPVACINRLHRRV